MAEGGPATLAEHATGLGRFVGGSDYLSLSENFLGPRNWNGEPFGGRLYLIDAQGYRANGGQTFNQSQVLQTAANAEEADVLLTMYNGSKRFEGEIIAKGSIQPGMIKTPTQVVTQRALSAGTKTLKYGGKTLIVVGAVKTGWDIGASINESVEKGTPEPAVHETLKQGGAWGGAWAGGEIGAWGFAFGPWVGIPTTIAGSIVGAVIGEKGVDEVYTDIRDYDYAGAKQGVKEVIIDAAAFKVNWDTIERGAAAKQTTINDMYDHWGE